MYYVNMNRPGYLPDYEPNDFDTWHAAADFALDILDQLQNDAGNALDDAAARDALITAQNTDTPTLGDFVIFDEDGNAVWAVFIFEEQE